MLYGRPAAIVLAAISMGIVFTIVLEPTRTHADFFTFFDSARQLRAGGDPYLGEPLRQGAGYNLNPPSVLLLFLPFAWLPLLPGFLLWTVINTAAYAVSAWLIARHVAPRYGVEVVAAVLVSQVTFLGLQLGQHVGLLMGVLTAAWLADRRQRFFVAGALLGGAMAVKLFLGVFLFYAIWRRSLRMLWGMAAGFLVIVLLGLIPAGLSGYRSWLTVLGRVTWAAHLLNASLFGFFTRLLAVPPRAMFVTPLANRPDLVRPLSFVCVALVACVAAWRAAGTRDVDRVWLLTLTASLLCSPLGWAYYAPLAAGPIASLAVRASRSTKVLLAAGYGCCLMPYAVLIALPLGRLATLTLASIYMWGVLCWFAAATTADHPETVLAIG